MPYGYFLNSFIFKVKKIDLTGSVVIFDEAHNIIQMARDASGIVLKDKSIQKSKGELEMLKESNIQNIQNNPKDYSLQSKDKNIDKLT